MKKEKVPYTFSRYDGKPVQANKELPFEMRLQARLMLDEICFLYNKKMLEKYLNKALIDGNKEEFMEYSDRYREFLWESA